MSAAYRFPPNFNPQQPIPGATAPVNMASQRFCLRWNNHQSNLLSVFDQLLQSESFVDVTLAVEGKLLKAHKMVLSACSPYFQSLFVNHPDKHPIVILKDVPYSDMKSLLDFMYRGEVSVDQDRLTHFLRVAECLRIKGLTEVNEEKCDNIANSLSNQNSQVPNLQRINQQNKRFAPQQQQFGNMLGNYLMSQPKRKRGRPRRLSGNETDETDGKDSVIHGSPEMLEVKMGMDGFAGNSDESTGGEGDDGRIRDEDEDGLPGTSQSEKYRESRTDEEIRAETILYLECSEENNQNHSNLIFSPSVAQGLEIFPIKKQENVSVIISTEVARNLLNNDKNNTTEKISSKIKLEPPEDSLTEEEFHIKIEPLEFENEETVETDIKSEEIDFETSSHFLTTSDFTKESYEKKKNEFLEYMPNTDGSVVCKRCGEVLPSRTHWYRHKYKFHVNSSFLTPAPLFKCERCSVFFKSRKGYLGHTAARHSEKEKLREKLREEAVIQISEKEETPLPIDVRNTPEKPLNWKEQRIQEEKLVADIINRVKRECEAQGAMITRKGYTRRTTVMNVNID